MVYTSPESPWIKTLKPFLDKKKALQADAWGYHPSAEVDNLFQVNTLALQPNYNHELRFHSQTSQ